MQLIWFNTWITKKNHEGTSKLFQKAWFVQSWKFDISNFHCLLFLLNTQETERKWLLFQKDSGTFFLYEVGTESKYQYFL